VDYPAENANLRTKIIREGGVLLSEYPPGIRANKYVFQARNRIISGLGKALLMMESRIQSGSMLTVQHALDQGKEVYAYPGLPGTEWAEGAHQLLREGANYFTSAEDILEDLGWDKPSKHSIEARPAELPPMSEEQRKVFRLLGQGELSFDQLADKTGLSPSAISTALTMLQMMGLIKALPGKCYSKV
jgi:DNA processing protein